jgi:hypothetical protein
MVRNYHHSLRNNPKERCYQLLRGGSLKKTQDQNTNVGGFQSGFIEDSDLLGCDTEWLVYFPDVLNEGNAFCFKS